MLGSSLGVSFLFWYVSCIHVTRMPLVQLWGFQAAIVLVVSLVIGVAIGSVVGSMVGLMVGSVFDVVVGAVVGLLDAVVG